MYIRYFSGEYIVQTETLSCFFCDLDMGAYYFCEAATFILYSRVRECALLLENKYLLAKLSAGDMIATDAKYHPNCLSNLYNRARCIKRCEQSEQNCDDMFSSIALAELISYWGSIIHRGSTSGCVSCACIVRFCILICVTAQTSRRRTFIQRNLKSEFQISKRTPKEEK